VSIVSAGISRFTSGRSETLLNNGIDWIRVGSGERFEKIVSVLLSTLNPGSDRVDGAGGDGGRDHQFKVGQDLHVWQSKYFVRRLAEAAGRKAQITKSLARAALLAPASWTLVTPMVPTPEERAWFDALQVKYPFPLTWKGGDWLDAQLAEHPSIVRHFMGAEEEYVSLLRELNEERDVLIDGLPAATPRIQDLAAKLNDSNPFYKIHFAVENGRVVRTQLVPKYAGAERDSPVTFGFTLSTVPPNDALEARLRSAMDWGEQIELPASSVRRVVITGPPGFGGEWNQGHITLGPAQQQAVDLTLRLSIHDPDGRQLASLPARLIAATPGLRGVTLRGKDLTGVIETRLRMDKVESTFSLNLSTTWDQRLLPSVALPVLRFLRHAAPPNTMTFGVGEDAINTSPIALPSGMSVPAEQVRVVEHLERLQIMAGESFALPRSWTIDDIHEIDRAIRLLDGHLVDLGKGPITYTTEDEAFLNAIAAHPNSALTITSDYTAHIAGHELSLGPFTLRIEAPAVTTSRNPDGSFDVSISPGDGTPIQASIGAPREEWRSS
jgi:hypothetical protein